MTLRSISWKYKILAGLVIFSACMVPVFLYHKPIWEKILVYYHLFSDREQIRAMVTSYGMAAPAVFVSLQIFQVLFAPIPGEATGFIGGYIFGAGQGFLYSSIGLTAGSWLNFKVGRFFGRRYVRKWISTDRFERLDAVLKRQGVIVIFVLFVFPGFPKDYLCLFLGLSTLPAGVFMILSALGRMPGTFMLTLQGALLHEKFYGFFGVLLALCLLIALVAYRYREPIYGWVEKLNGKA